MNGVASRVELFCDGKSLVNDRNMALFTHWRLVSDAQEGHDQTVSYSYKQRRSNARVRSRLSADRPNG